MKWLSRLVVLLIVLGVVAMLAGPIGPLPGVRIGGTETPPPADWSAIDLPDEVRLRTTGGLVPRVVIIWIIEDNNALYVLGANDSGWVQATLKDPAVELRIADKTYALNATPESDPVELYRKYINRYAAGYPDIVATMPTPADAEQFASGGVVFRLDRR